MSLPVILDPSIDIDAEGTLATAKAELARRSFAEFVKLAWSLVDPSVLIWGPHVAAVCEHLQAVAEGRIRRLIINIPPGHAKSMLVSVLWPAWMWARNPGWRLLGASYGMDLAVRDAVRSRTIIRSDFYAKHYRGPAGWDLKDDQDNKTYYENTKGGFRIAMSPTGQGTGHRGDGLIVDDPMKAMDANSKLARENVITWYTETMSSRFNSLANAIKVLVMQRLHEDDLTGYLLRNARNDYEHLVLPSEFEKKRAYKTSIGADWRKTEGELLFPEKFPREVLDEAKRPGAGMGPMAYAGQHQQRPAPAEGNLLKRAWMQKRYRTKLQAALPGVDSRLLPEKFSSWCMSVDAAFKDTAKSDRVAIWVLASKGPDVFCLDLSWGRMNFNATIQAIKDLASKWRRMPILIEDKANGTAIIEVLRKQGFGQIIPVSPGKDSKESRVAAMAPCFEAGNIWLPQEAPWVADFIEEAASFPKATHDDAVDALSYGVMRLAISSRVTKFEALGNFENLIGLESDPRFRFSGF